MSLEKWLFKATNELSKAGIGTSRLDALILLEDELGRSRAWLLSNPGELLNPQQIKRLERNLARRKKHEPLSYIRGFTEFYGRRFMINRHVLEPRPESETIIDILKQQPLAPSAIIADVGTGCGALGITAALEITGSQVDLYDISSSALGVAKHNTQIHELHLHARKMDLLARPLRAYDVILANLPYVPDTWKINEAARLEPKIAIFGGKDGLNIYRRFFLQLKRHRHKPKVVLTESMPPQHSKLEEIAESNGFRQERVSDFIQLFFPTSR